MFSGLTAWFSPSVDKDKVKLWCDGGGVLEASDTADFLFSANTKCAETVQLFESEAYLDEALSVFHPNYIAACLRHGGRGKVNVGKYFFPPESIQEIMRSMGSMHGWETDYTDNESMEDNRSGHNECNEGYSRNPELNHNGTLIDQSNTHSNMERKKQELKVRNKLLTVKTKEQENPRQRSMHTGSKQLESTYMNKKGTFRNISPTNKRRAELCDSDTTFPARRSPRLYNLTTNSYEQSRINRADPTHPSTRTQNQSLIYQPNEHFDTKITASKEGKSLKQNTSTKQLKPKQTDSGITSENTTKKMERLCKRLGPDVNIKNPKRQEISEHDGVGGLTQRRLGRADKSANGNVADRTMETCEQTDEQTGRPVVNRSVYLSEELEMLRLQDMQLVSGRWRTFRVGKNGCECVEVE